MPPLHRCRTIGPAQRTRRTALPLAGLLVLAAASVAGAADAAADAGSAAPPGAASQASPSPAPVPKWQTQLSTTPVRGRRSLDEELAQIVALLPGRYQGTSPATSQRPGETASPSPVFHKIVRIEAPQFGRTVFYHQIGRDGFEGAPIQQKIYAFDESPSRDANRMKAWVIPPGRGLVNLEASRDELRTLQPASLMVFPRACDIAWKRIAGGFEANVSASACEYESRAFRTTVRPDMTYVLTKDSFSLQEAMRRANGSEIFAMQQPVVSRRIDGR
jgi:hypothetical protein